MQTHSVPQGGAETPSVYSCAWPRAEAAEDAYIGSYGRVFDLIVLGRPGPAPENPRMAPLGIGAVRQRPAGADRAEKRTQPVSGATCWWRGTAAPNRRTPIRFALPLLQRAEKVTVLTVEGGATTGPSGEEAALHLRRNGVKAEALTLKRSERMSGEAIGEITLDQAASLGCDLIVKSAYTQSRLRQMIFGGATRHILANATLPVLMAH